MLESRVDLKHLCHGHSSFVSDLVAVHVQVLERPVFLKHNDHIERHLGMNMIPYSSETTHLQSTGYLSSSFRSNIVAHKIQHCQASVILENEHELNSSFSLKLVIGLFFSNRQKLGNPHGAFIADTVESVNEIRMKKSTSE